MTPDPGTTHDVEEEVGSLIDLRDSAVVIAEEKGSTWIETTDDIIFAGLLRALDHRDPSVSSRAERTLADMDPDRRTAWFREQIRDSDPAGIAHLATVIARLRFIELVPDLVRVALDTSSANLEAIGEALKTFPHFQELIDWIQAPTVDEDESERVADTLEEELKARLHEGSVREKVHNISRIKAPLSASLAGSLISLAAGDPSEEVKFAATEALGSATADVRVQAVRTIIRKAAVPHRIAALALLSGGTLEEMSLLVEMLHDKSPKVAKEAIALLGAQPAPGALAILWGALLGVSRDRQQLILDLLTRFDPGSVSVLARQVIGSSQARERMLGVWVLATVDPRSSRQLLLEALTDPAAEVRVEALAGFHGVTEEHTIRAVGDRVSDPDPAVRTRAVEVLSGLEGELSATYLLDACKDPDEEVRRAAETALLSDGSETVARVLVKGLSSPTHRRIARNLIARIGEIAIKPLVAGLSDAEPEIAEVIGAVLTDASADAMLVEDLGARAVDKRLAALDGLLAMKAIDHVGEIAARLEDPVTEVRVKVAEVLGGLGDGGALEPLKRAFVSDPNMEVVAALEQALRRLTEQDPAR
jgi:HEAT repeat protein